MRSPSGDQCGAPAKAPSEVSCKTWRFRLFSGCRGEIQPAAVEVDRVDEVMFVAEAAGRVLHPLDLGVDGFAGGVGDTVLEVCDDVGEAAFEHAGDFLHWSQTAAHRPTTTTG